MSLKYPWLFCKIFLTHHHCQQKPRLTSYFSERLYKCFVGKISVRPIIYHSRTHFLECFSHNCHCHQMKIRLIHMDFETYVERLSKLSQYM